MAIRKELRSSLVVMGEASTGSRAAAIKSPFAQTFSSHVAELHIQQLQLFATDHLGTRMSAFGTRALGARSLEVNTATLAMVTHGQDFHRELSAFGHGAASGYGKNRLQTIKVEDTASADCQVYGRDSGCRVTVSRFIDRSQDLTSKFVFVHAHLQTGARTGLV